VAVETHARTVSLRLRRHLKAKGTVSVADGTHGCYRNVTVKIQRRKSGTWKTIRKTVTDSRGSYKTAIADKTGRYRAKVAKITLDNGDFCSKDKSGTKRHRH
jgi:5-hydroxyisourate hydrolase-like protein (transthyretin family)